MKIREFNLSIKFSAFALLLAASGCSPDEPEVPKGNWNKLCAIQDCEQYPVGYGTSEVREGELFYFPLEKAPRYDFFWRTRPQYKDIDDSGSIQRTYTPPPGYSRISLRKITNFHKEWLSSAPPPMMAHFFGPTEDGGLYLSDFRLRLPSIADSHISKAIGHLSIAIGNFVRSDFTPESYASFNDDFWIVFEGEYENSRYKLSGRSAAARDLKLPDPVFRSFLLMSKERIFNGAHLLFGCAHSCIYLAVLPPPGWQPETVFAFSTDNANGDLWREPASFCGKPNPLVSCDQLDKKLEHLPADMKLFEQAFMAFKNKPQPLNVGDK